MNSIVKSTAIKFGLIVAAVQCGYLLIGYAIDLSLLTSSIGGAFTFLTGTVCLILAAVSVKKQMGGFISFKNAFTSIIITYLVYTDIRI